MSKKTFLCEIMIWIVTIICVCPTVSQQDSSNENKRCVSPWQKVHRTCVLFNKTKLHWLEARNACLSASADLVTVNDVASHMEIKRLMFDHVSAPGLLKWWIGLRQINETWFWVDIDQAYEDFPKWAPSAGQAINSEDGSLFYNRCGSIDYQGFLIDENCTEERPFICGQIQLTPLTSLPVFPTTVSTTSQTATPDTSYPKPTPDTVTPSTPTYLTHSTNKPVENSTAISSQTNGSTYKSTSKPTEKPTDKPTGKPTDKPTGRPTDKPTGKPTDKPTGRQIDKPTGRPTDKPTGKPTDKPTGRPIDKPTGKPTDKPTGKPTDKPSGKTSNKTTGKPSDKPVTGRPTGKPTGKPTDTPDRTTKKQKEEKDVFQGCFAVNYESTCPPVEAFGISWPRSEAGRMVKVPCDKGHAKWKCDKNPVCWREEPDVKQCTSESIQELTTQMEEFLANTNDSEKAVAFTENLASSVESDSVMSEQDIYQSTKLMKAASNARPKNSTEAKKIIKNVAKCGSLLVGKEKKNTWASMTKESQRTVASSLLSSMESVTNNMLNSFDEPTEEKIEEENMAIELRVIKVDTEGPAPKSAVFGEETNSFAIATENLKQFSTDGLARVVFINYNNVGELLKPDDNSADDSLQRQIISQVISASLGDKPEEEPLMKPIIFTMKTDERAKNQELKHLCSFWNFSLGYTGAWSQDGCSLRKHNETHTTCQCDHLTNFAILMDIHSTKVTPIHATTLSYITYVGIIISIICLFLAWITFVCLSIRCIRGSRSSYGNADANEYYGNSGSSSGSTAGSRSAQGERNSIHKNLVFCLFIAEVLFLAGIERTDNKIACAIIAGFLHYFFLSGFTWMFVEGIHILFMLVQVFDGARSRLKYYYAIGYGSPLLVVGISALVYYEGYGTERYCWLTSERMFIWSFAGPVAFIILVNVIILVYAMSAVCKHSEYVFAKEKSAGGNFKAWIQGALALEVLLGLTWVFGYFYISEEAIPMAYLFTIFNSLQGLFIFVFHCLLNKKVRKEYCRFIDYPKRPVSSGTHSSKDHSGSGPHTAAYHMNGTRKHSGFMDLSKYRRPSSRSTTSA